MAFVKLRQASVMGSRDRDLYMNLSRIDAFGVSDDPAESWIRVGGHQSSFTVKVSAEELKRQLDAAALNAGLR